MKKNLCPKEVVQSVMTLSNEADVTNPNHPPSSCMDMSKKKKPSIYIGQIFLQTGLEEVPFEKSKK
jgi:hypothetical protein